MSFQVVFMLGNAVVEDKVGDSWISSCDIFHLGFAVLQNFVPRH
jgi:hypothetical protein